MADLARPDNADGAGVEVEAHQPFRGEIALTHPDVGTVVLAVECEDHAHGELSNRVGRVGRDPDHGDAQFGGGSMPMWLNPAERSARSRVPSAGSRSSTGRDATSLTKMHTTGAPRRG
jgi:hypothetical protein